ncbi:MAG: hypothetical protein JWR69_1611, partial [Pedosphaera sp.]|nr:hypothetical protein [Pedosphaera sp.]
VTDNGVPPLSATNSFTVIVNEVNSAPVLPVQTNRTINELTLLTVANTATDSDLPVNTLNYQLITSPTGASIDAGGVITWTPSAGQSGSTNAFTTVVTDNGLPALTATNTFFVTVNGVQSVPAPVILSFNLSDGIATITWGAVPNQSYRLQYNSDLSSTNWLDQVPDIMATGPTATATNAVGSSAQQFYRILSLP